MPVEVAERPARYQYAEAVKRALAEKSKVMDEIRDAMTKAKKTTDKGELLDIYGRQYENFVSKKYDAIEGASRDKLFSSVAAGYGRTLIDAGRLDEAEDVLRDAVTANNDNALATEALGHCLFKKARREGIDTERGQALLGEAMERHKKVYDGLRSGQIRAADQSYVQVGDEYGRMLLEAGRIDEAAEVFRDVLGRTKNRDVMANNGLGVCLNRKAREKGVGTEEGRALLSEAQSNLVEANINAQKEGTSEQLRAAIKNNLAVVNGSLGQRDNARSLYEEAAQLDNNNSRIHANRAVFHMESREYAQANQCVGEVNRIKTQGADTFNRTDASMATAARVQQAIETRADQVGMSLLYSTATGSPLHRETLSALRECGATTEGFASAYVTKIKDEGYHTPTGKMAVSDKPEVDEAGIKDSMRAMAANYPGVSREELDLMVDTFFERRIKPNLERKTQLEQTIEDTLLKPPAGMEGVQQVLDQQQPKEGEAQK